MTWLKKRVLIATISFAVIMAVVSGLAFQIYQNKIEDKREALLEHARLAELPPKTTQMKLLLRTVYLNLRTISLLPSIRSVTGGNIKAGEDDVLTSSRLSGDAYQSVQQIYNNMASEVAVSEIYAVLDGLDAKNGETPFFMFDTVIVSPQKTETGESEEVVNPDFPEEAETAEYEYFPKQIDELRNKRPTFNFESLDDIPSVASEMMRTCDNTQYLSLAHDNVNDSFGFSMAVPFYNITTNALAGEILAIIRGAAVEAKLLGIPFVIITDNDKKEAAKLNFEMPKAIGTFALASKKYPTVIYDRRNKALGDVINKAKTTPNESLFQNEFEVGGDTWTVYNYVSPDNIAAAIAPAKAEIKIQIILVFVALLLCCFVALLLSYGELFSI